MRWLSEQIDRFNDRLGHVVSWLCLAMVLLGVLNAVLRYAGRYAGLSVNSAALTEAQWYLFSLLFLLGSAWTLREDRHVRVDVLYSRLSPRAKAIVDIAGGFLFLLPFCIFGIWSSWPYVSNSISLMEVSPDPGGLPRYPIKAAIPLAFVLLIIQGLSELIKRVRFLAGAEDES